MGVPSSGLPEPSAWAVAHARELATTEPLPPGRVVVELVTDPWSIWCWGFEPVRRALEARYPTIAFHLRVGGMFERLPDPDEIGFDVERFFAVVQRTTGMPLRLDATRRERPESTYPACVHAAAVRLLRPDLERAYVRRLREAVWLDGRNVSRKDVAAEEAERVGVPRDEFLEALASGEPEREFRATLAELHHQGLHAYPTYLVRARDRVARVEGFQTLPGLLAIVEQVSGRIHPAAPAPDLLELVPPGERVATRELAEVAGGGVEAAYDALRALEARGLLAHERHPGGDTWRRA